MPIDSGRCKPKGYAMRSMAMFTTKSTVSEYGKTRTTVAERLQAGASSRTDPERRRAKAKIPFCLCALKPQSQENQHQDSAWGKGSPLADALTDRAFGRNRSASHGGGGDLVFHPRE